MTMWRRWAAPVAAGLMAMVFLVGCGAGDGDSEGAADQAPGQEGAGADREPLPGAAEEAGEADEAEAEAADPGAELGGEAGQLVDTRSIIYTGQITVRVDEMDDAAAAATALADRYGGFVGGDRRTVDEDRSIAVMVLRIPSENFTAAVNDLGELGDEESRELETEDVTEEVVDLETRIATAEASVARTRELLEQARSIDDVVAVEAELSTREASLARLQARQRTLEDLTTLSTITARLLGPEAEQEEEPQEEADGTGFLAGLGAGWNAFTTSLTFLATVFGAVLPFLVAVGAPVGAALWWARRRRPNPSI